MGSAAAFPQTRQPGSKRQKTRLQPSPMNRHQILVVEDNNELRENVLIPSFLNAGYACTGVATALEMYRCLVGRSFDLILLDLGLPDEDGFSSIQHLRLLTNAAIIVLTGNSSDADHVRGLSIGADAYLCKPIDSDVLLAWAQTIIRRTSSASDNVVAGQRKTESRWRVDDSGWRLIAPGGGAINLSLAEKIIVSVFIAASGKTVHRDDLAARLMSEIHAFSSNKLEMLIHRFRRKVLRATGQNLPLMAIRGVGYIFNI
jgi:DNA-binding response OmpR family regulator